MILIVMNEVTQIWFSHNKIAISRCYLSLKMYMLRLQYAIYYNCNWYEISYKMSNVLNATRMHCPKYNNYEFVTGIFCLLGLLLGLTRGGIWWFIHLWYDASRWHGDVRCERLVGVRWTSGSKVQWESVAVVALRPLESLSKNSFY